MQRLWLITCWSVLCATAVQGQWHDRGYLASSGDGFHVFDTRGGVRSTLVSPVHKDVYDLTMDVDNRHVLLVMRDQKRIVRYDPFRFAVTGTLCAGSPLVSPTGVAIDQNGDYFVVDGGAGAVFGIAAGGKLQTVYANPTLLDQPDGGLRIDPTTGDLLVLNTSRLQDQLYTLRRDGSAISTLGSGFSARYGFDVHLPTSDVFTTSCCRPFAPPVRVLRFGQSRPEDFYIQNPVPDGAYAVRCDRASAYDQRLVLAPTFDQGGIWLVNLTSRHPTSLSRIGTSIFALDFLEGRNVQTVAVGKWRWDVRLSFPGEPGNIYFVILSLNGTRPSWLLADGRTVNLVLDNLAQLTLTSELGSVFRNNRSVLDAAGEGVAHLDVSSISSAVRGLRVYIEAITFNARAPLGIQTIADPVPLLIEER